jgi:hypothetical protein
MKPVKTISLCILVLFVACSFTQPLIPVSGTGSTTSSASALSPVIDLNTFSASVVNQNSDQIVGIYAADLFALPVVQQPASQPAFVSTKDNVVTQFSMAKQYGSAGFVAHNYLAGLKFFDVEIGDKLDVVMGDGTIVNYTVIQIKKYQALSPTSPYSSFINLQKPSTTLSYIDLFNETYARPNNLILQTCISYGNSDSWGRLFVIALPSSQLASAREPNL